MCYFCLTEAEMPELDCICMKVQGLSIGGSVNVASKQFGFISFMRGKQGHDKERYKLYRNKVLLPFIQETRKIFNG